MHLLIMFLKFNSTSVTQICLRLLIIQNHVSKHYVIIFRYDGNSKFCLVCISSMKSSSWIIRFCDDFNNSDDWRRGGYWMNPSLRVWSWLNILISSYCISRGCSEVSCWVDSLTMCCSSCHHSCVWEVSKTVSNDWIPVVNAWSMEHESRTILLLCFLENTFFMLWMLKNNILL